MIFFYFPSVFLQLNDFNLFSKWQRVRNSIRLPFIATILQKRYFRKIYPCSAVIESLARAISPRTFENCAALDLTPEADTFNRCAGVVSGKPGSQGGSAGWDKPHRAGFVGRVHQNPCKGHDLSPGHANSPEGPHHIEPDVSTAKKVGCLLTSKQYSEGIVSPAEITTLPLKVGNTPSLLQSSSC